MVLQFENVGVDIKHGPIEVAPTAHHFMGGLKINTDGSSSLKNLFGAEPSARYSFYLGAILCGEIEQIRKSGVPTVVLGGQKHLRAAMAALLEHCTTQTVILLSDEVVAASTAKGALKIYQAE